MPLREDIRNVAIVAHVDLVDDILEQARVLHRFWLEVYPSELTAKS